jgi:hypothetical protein
MCRRWSNRSTALALPCQRTSVKLARPGRKSSHRAGATSPRLPGTWLTTPAWVTTSTRPPRWLWAILRIARHPPAEASAGLITRPAEVVVDLLQVGAPESWTGKFDLGEMGRSSTMPHEISRSEGHRSGSMPSSRAIGRMVSNRPAERTGVERVNRPQAGGCRTQPLRLRSTAPRERDVHQAAEQVLTVWVPLGRLGMPDEHERRAGRGFAPARSRGYTRGFKVPPRPDRLTRSGSRRPAPSGCGGARPGWPAAFCAADPRTRAGSALGPDSWRPRWRP